MTALNFPANPSNGDVYENYQYDGTDGVWKRLPSSSLGINGLADVTITTPADGESLVYDNATGEWVNADATVEVYGVDTAATDYFMIPVGGDSDRPVTPANGHIRFNSDSGEPEYYSESEGAWFLFREQALGSFSVSYLVIAGGGGGGGERGAGGGAGGYRCNVTGENSGGGASAESALNIAPGTYTVTVGAGGAGVVNGVASSGNASVFSTITSIAGGGGGGGSPSQEPLSGGSGGGGGGTDPDAGAAGTTGQGFAGGGGGSVAGGGGGGAGSVGQDASGENGGDGGSGVSSSITGSSVARAGGGGGGGDIGSSAGVGTDGGGNGGLGSGSGSNGTTNTGGGGGGARKTSSGASGGSGVVILKVPSTVSASFSVGLTEDNGGAGQTVGDYKVYTVTAGTGTVTFA